MGKSTISIGPFSIAMLVYQRVTHIGLILYVPDVHSTNRKKISIYMSCIFIRYTDIHIFMCRIFSIKTTFFKHIRTYPKFACVLLFQGTFKHMHIYIYIYAYTCPKYTVYQANKLIINLCKSTNQQELTQRNDQENWQPHPIKSWMTQEKTFGASGRLAAALRGCRTGTW